MRNKKNDSDTGRNVKYMETKNYNGKHRIVKNTIFAVFCILFAAIYEAFSHQVYSLFMIGAFLFSVLLGIVPDLIRKKMGHTGNEIALALQQCGIYTLTVGSIFRGILDIYGTTNRSGAVYWVAGGVLFAVGILMERMGKHISR